MISTPAAVIIASFVSFFLGIFLVIGLDDGCTARRAEFPRRPARHGFRADGEDWEIASRIVRGAKII